MGGRGVLGWGLTLRHDQTKMELQTAVIAMITENNLLLLAMPPAVREAASLKKMMCLVTSLSAAAA
jgi:hypothetical protein